MKTQTPIVGVVENMSGFVCPNCSHQCDIFAPSTGGASGMCEVILFEIREFEIEVVGLDTIRPKGPNRHREGQECVG